MVVFWLASVCRLRGLLFGGGLCFVYVGFLVLVWVLCSGLSVCGCGFSVGVGGFVDDVTICASGYSWVCLWWVRLVVSWVFGGGCASY